MRGIHTVCNEILGVGMPTIMEETAMDIVILVHHLSTRFLAEQHKAQSPRLQTDRFQVPPRRAVHDPFPHTKFVQGVAVVRLAQAAAAQPDRGSRAAANKETELGVREVTGAVVGQAAARA